MRGLNDIFVIQMLVVLTLGLGPLQWVTIMDVGLSLKPVHLPFFALGLAGWAKLLSSQIVRSSVAPAGKFAWWYFGYICALVFSLILNGGSVSEVAKNTAHFAGAIGWIFALSTLTAREILKAIFWGGGFACAFFLFVALFTLQVQGIDAIGVIKKAISTGNPAPLQFTIFKTIFSSGTPQGTDAIRTSLRHTLLGFIFIAAVISLSRIWTSKIAKVIALAAIAIIVLSLSRSVTLALLFATLPALIMLPRNAPHGFVWLVLIAPVGVLILIWLFDPTGIVQITEQRFGNLGSDGRVTMFAAALSLIEDRPVLGYGPVYRFDFGAVRELQVHNLFLGAWLEGGLLCLIPAIGFTFTLITFGIRCFLHFADDTEGLFVFGLLALPLLRSMLSGSAGNYTLPEWLCIAIVFAYGVGARRAKVKGSSMVSTTEQRLN